MRDTNIGMTKIYGGEKINGLFFGHISIVLNNKELKLRFGTDEQGYIALKNIFQLRPFDNKTSEPYRHYFTGSYNKGENEIKIRVEQGNLNKRFSVKCNSILLLKNLLWFQTIKDEEQVKDLVEIFKQD